MVAGGGKDPGKVEVLFSRKPGVEAGGAGERLHNMDFSNAISKELVSTMGASLHAVPDVFLTFCKEALDKRSEFLTWLTEFQQTGNLETAARKEIAKQVESCQQENTAMLEKFGEAKNSQKKVISELAKKVENLVQESEMQRESYRILKSEGDTLVSELRDKLESLTKELSVERDKSNQMSDRLKAGDNTLQKAKAKIRDLETQATTNEAKTQQLSSSMKQMEAQMKAKEVTLEARAKESQKNTKSSDGMVSILEKKRETLEARLLLFLFPLLSITGIGHIFVLSADFRVTSILPPAGNPPVAEPHLYLVFSSNADGLADSFKVRRYY